MVLRHLASALGILLASTLSSHAAEGSSADVTHVGGSAEAELERLIDAGTGDVSWRAGRCFIETPLPEGYAPPTPPGALEIKSYPVVRRAVVSSDDGGRAGGGFWPLFRHIQGRDIAMTSPVEMDYHGLRPGESAAPDSWSMAFLYRRVDQGPAGRDGIVDVRDSEPMTVLAAGLRGGYEGPEAATGMQSLTAWLAAHPEWEVAGDVRALHYNGPMTRNAEKWSEVQVPVRRVAASPKTEP